METKDVVSGYLLWLFLVAVCSWASGYLSPYFGFLSMKLGECFCFTAEKMLVTEMAEWSSSAGSAHSSPLIQEMPG